MRSQILFLLAVENNSTTDPAWNAPSPPWYIENFSKGRYVRLLVALVLEAKVYSAGLRELRNWPSKEDSAS